MNCKQITTVSMNGVAYANMKELSIKNEADGKLVENRVINIHPDFEYQTIEGFGGSMTESSAYLLSKMDPETRKKALACYFGEDGLNTRFVRTHLDSCDFSLNQYTAVSDPMSDPSLETFSLERDKQYIIPMLKEAMAMSKEPISVMLSPWSPPACWKTPAEVSRNDLEVYGMLGVTPPPENESTRSYGGSLKPEYYGSWAKYIVKFVEAYLEEDIPVTMLSIQNEPLAAVFWDTCIWTGEQEKVFLRDYLYPEMEKAGLTGKIEVFIWDHNKERVVERTGEVIDDDTAEMVSGIAFHWYSGDHYEAIQMLRERYPDKVLMLSECCEMVPSDEGELNSAFYRTAVRYAHDIIGNLNAGMHRWIDWNLILDKEGGPRHVTGGCTAGIVAAEDGTFTTSLVYHYIGHFAKYIRPGAKRIGFSRYTDAIEVTAVKNPDGQIVTVLLNKNDWEINCSIRIDGKLIPLTLPAQTISTIVIE